MRVLVTGVTGFIGKYVVERLLEQGHDVVAVSRNMPNETKKTTQESIIQWINADLLDFTSCKKTVLQAKAEILIHIAWYAEHGKFWNAKENFAWVISSNYLVQEFSIAGGRRVVMIGSCAEYDWHSGGYCIEGITPILPKSIYGKTKDIVRRYTEYYAELMQLEWIWARVFFPFGSGESCKRLLPSVIHDLRHGYTVKCSHGRQYRDFMHVKEVARALSHLATATHVTGVFNISSGVPTQIAEIVRYCADIISPNASIDFGAITTLDSEPIMLVGDNTRLRSTGWRNLETWQESVSSMIKKENKHS